MRRVMIAVVACAIIVVGCGALSGTGEPSGSSNGTVSLSTTSEPTTTTELTTVTTTPAAPFGVVQTSQDRSSQTLAYDHPWLGPSTIWISRGWVPQPGERPGVSVTGEVDGTIDVLLDWSAPDNIYDAFEFAGAPQFERTRHTSVVPSPVDRLGHVFFEWGDGRLPGVSYLVPTATGSDDFGTFDDPLTTGVYGATVEDVNGDGVYEIVQTSEGCSPDCPLPGETITYAWNGSSYEATEGTPPTQPPPVPSTTVPPPPPDSTLAPGPDYGFFDAPQLGVEPVRGSGCGVDETLGDPIPDGWWYGFSYPWDRSSFEFEVVCIYYGESARAHLTECSASRYRDLCRAYFSEEFWMVAENDRTWTVPLSPTIEVRGDPNYDRCFDWDVRRAGNLSLIHIVGGRAVSLETRCPPA